MPGYFVTLGKGAYVLVEFESSFKLAELIDRHARTSADRFLTLKRPDGSHVQLDASQVVLIQPPAPAQDRVFTAPRHLTPAQARESITPDLAIH